MPSNEFSSRRRGKVEPLVSEDIYADLLRPLAGEAKIVDGRLSRQTDFGVMTTEVLTPASDVKMLRPGERVEILVAFRK